MPRCSDISVATDAVTSPPARAHVAGAEGTERGGRHIAEPRLIAHRYRLLDVLGRGAMGTVWRAHDELLRRPVALKQCPVPERVPGSSPLREARAAAGMSHPGIVCVHDYVQESNDEWIVMEVLSGRPLSDHIQQRHRLPVAEVRTLAGKVLDALCALHDAGLVHRDVKPSNIHVCDDGRVVLTDFGLTSDEAASGAADGMVAGSLAYLAPEVIREGRFGPASDMYALGVTLFAAVEGRQPFAAGTTMSRIQAVMNRPPRWCRYAGPLADLIHGLLAKDPRDRTDAVRARRLLDDDGWASWWVG